MSNRQEYLAGTDPISPLSYLKVDALTVDSEGARIRFGAISNRTYTIQLTDSLGVERDFQAVGGATRFYRLITPHQP